MMFNTKVISATIRIDKCTYFYNIEIFFLSKRLIVAASTSRRLILWRKNEKKVNFRTQSSSQKIKIMAHRRAQLDSTGVLESNCDDKKEPCDWLEHAIMHAKRHVSVIAVSTIVCNGGWSLHRSDRLQMALRLL